MKNNLQFCLWSSLKRWLIKTYHLVAKIFWNLPSKRFQFTPPFSPSKLSLKIVQILIMRLFNIIFIINVKENANKKLFLVKRLKCVFYKGVFVMSESLVETWLQRSSWGIQKFLKSCLNAPEIRTNVKKDNHLPQISWMEDWKNIPKNPQSSH